MLLPQGCFVLHPLSRLTQPTTGKRLAMTDAALWRTDGDYIRIILKGIQTEVKIGLHPWERHPERPSRLTVNIELFAPVTPEPLGTSREAIIDYDPIRHLIRGWRDRPHVDLLETLVDELFEACFADPKVAAARVSVLKPDIFNEVEAAGVEAYRRRPETAR